MIAIDKLSVKQAAYCTTHPPYTYTRQKNLLGIFNEKKKEGAGEIQKKQYILTIEEQKKPSSANFEASIKHAVLLALLQQKCITQWQYEQCFVKLHVKQDASSAF